MSKPLAIRAAYADMKIVKTRQVVQLILELPLADFDAAYEVLGGLPNPANERWFAIAAIKNAESNPRSLDARPQPEKDKPAGAKRDWRMLQPAEQAGIRCNEAGFKTFLSEEYPNNWSESCADAAECVRLICRVTSRSDLNRGENHANRVIWHQLNDQYEAWMRVGA